MINAKYGKPKKLKGIEQSLSTAPVKPMPLGMGI